MTKTKDLDLKDMEKFVVDFFHFNSFVLPKLGLKFLNFEMQNFETTSDEEMTKIRVVALDKIQNFLVETFVISICLGPQIFNIISNEVNTKGKYQHFMTCDFGWCG